MKGTCPLTTTAEWLNSESILGNEKTYELWMASKEGEVPEPVAGAFYFYIKAKPQKATDLLNDSIPDIVKSRFELDTNILDLINMASDDMFQDPSFKQWLADNDYLDKIFEGEKITRTPEKEKEVEAKIQSLEEMVAEVEDPMDNYVKLDPVQMLNTIKTNEILQKLAQKLSMFDYDKPFVVIDSKDAAMILGKTAIPYKDEAVFYYNDTTYYVKDKINLSTEFSKLAQPLLRIANKNALDNHYNKLIITPEGEAIMEELSKRYPEVENKNYILFKEKILNEALRVHSIFHRLNQAGQTSAEPISKEFINVVANLMDTLRVEFDNRFNKIKSYQIKTYTTFNELADILSGNDFEIKSEGISSEEFKAIESDLKKAEKELLDAVRNDPDKKTLDEKLDSFIEPLIRETNKQIREVGKKKLSEVKKALADPGTGPFLTEMAQNLRVFRKDITQKELDTYEKMAENQKAKNLVNTLFTLEKTLFKINDELDLIYSNKDNIITKLTAVDHYNTLLKDWLVFIKDGEKELLKSGISRTGFLYGFVSRLEALIEQGSAKVKEIKEEGAVKQTTSLLKSFTERVTAEYDAEIKKVEETSGDPTYKEKKLAELKADKEKYRFDEEKVRALYKGELGDSNWFSNMFVSYTSDSDPAVASFALFIKKHISEVIATAAVKGKAFAEDITPEMQTLGMDNVNFKKQWEEFTMVHKNMRGNDVVGFIAATKNWEAYVGDLKKRIKEAKDSRDNELLQELYKEKVQLDKVFNREFTPEYYEAVDKLLETDVEAYDALKEMDAEISDFKADLIDPQIAFENNDAVIELYAKKERLYSIYDEFNVLKDEKGQRIANSLTAHRKRTGKFYEAFEKLGLFQRNLDMFAQSCLNNPKYTGMLADADGNMTGFYLDLIDKWVGQNTKIKYTDAYNKLRSNIFKRLAEYSKELPDSEDLSKLYEQKSAILIGYKDNEGQVNPDLMKDKKSDLTAKFKSIEQTIEDIRFANKNSLSDSELTPKQKVAKENIKKALQELSLIQFKMPSEYYLDKMNDFLLVAKVPMTLDVLNADDLLKNPVKVDEIISKNPEFKRWFEANHIKVKSKAENGKVYINYKRLDLWNIAEPLDDADENGEPYLIKTSYTVNGVIRPAKGVPNSRYFYYREKNSYIDEVTGEEKQLRTIPYGLSEEERTEKYVGKVIDNKGNYLPLDKEQAAKLGVSTTYNVDRVSRNADKEIIKVNTTGSFINEDYYNLIANPTKKALLDKITSYHLNNQIGRDYSDKLYLDLPRLPINEVLEGVQTGALKDKWTDRLQGIWAGASAYFSGKGVEEANRLSKRAGDVEEGFDNTDAEEARDESNIAKNITNPIVDKIPVKGISNIPINQITYDVVSILNFYMTQLERQKVLSKINPVAKAMVETLENADTAMSNMTNIRDKKEGVANNIKAILGKGKSSRAATVRSLYNRELQNEVFSEKHLDWLNKVTSAITGGAALNYFALNLPSAIKNYWGILWQLQVEAAAGEYFDTRSMVKGKARAFVAMKDWSARIWGGKYNSVDSQLILMMDPQQGKTEEVISKDFSRTFARDVAGLSWAFSPRKFMEMEGALQLMYSIMYHTKIERIVNGEKTYISYADAFQLNDKNQLVLLEGIPATYGITYDEKGLPTLGSEFIRMQNIVHEKYKDLNGAFAKFESPQAQRFFAYRLFAFMRRYFTSMFLHRFGKRRANYALESVRAGFYREAVLTLAETLKTLGKNIPFMSPKEAASLKRMATEVALIMAISAIAVMLFGYDDDDKDRFKKLRDKSGALGDEDFHLDGWLSNHALTLLLKTQAENQSFIPLPGLGLQNYIDLASTTSIAFGPTITAAATLLTDLTMHAMPGEDESLYYERDTGPYSWQKEGSAKIWNHLATTAGFSGSQIEPVKGLESFESFRR
jgi:hypothetical protein